MEGREIINWKRFLCRTQRYEKLQLSRRKIKKQGNKKMRRGEMNEWLLVRRRKHKRRERKKKGRTMNKRKGRERKEKKAKQKNERMKFSDETHNRL
jgi:hypothetical protein